MEVEVNREKICINRLVLEKKEVFFVQNDVIVPDTKPDILNTINITGNVCLNKKEVLDDKIKVEGCVNSYIMYLPDSKDENLRALNCTLDFSEKIDVKDVKSDMTLVTKANIKDMECKVINGRKISVKAGIELDVKLYSNEDVELINQINNVNDVQLLRKTFNVNSLVGNGKTNVYAKDTLKANQNDEIAEVLKLDIAIVNKDLKFSYNKVLTKAEADVKILYLTEDGRIGRIDGKIPIIGFIDIEKISEENICDVNYDMKNIVVKLNNAEEHSIYVELEIEPTCMAYEKKKIDIIQDLYSPSTALEYTQKKITAVADKNEMSSNFNIKGSAQISGLEEGNLLDVETIPVLENVKVTEDKITYSGKIEMNFIYENANTLNSKNAKIDFEVSEENREKISSINVDTELGIGKTSFEVRKDVANAEIELQIYTKTNKNINMNIIDNINVSEKTGESSDYDSLILYITKEGDTLWNIAKKFNSTVEELAKVNGIEDTQKLDILQKIYIPKFNYIRKETREDVREKATV